MSTNKITPVVGIDYKAEVLKVEPSAYVGQFTFCNQSLYDIHVVTEFGTLISKKKKLTVSSSKSESRAWRLAYTALKQQNRIK